MVKYLEGVENKVLNLTTEKLSKSDSYNEYVMTSIRRMEGISRKEIEVRFSAFQNHFEESLESLPKEYIIQDSEQIKLSRKGLIFADFVGSVLFKV
jgi:oxygen-independent coproporphyrinogen-3 oxidase